MGGCGGGEKEIHEQACLILSFSFHDAGMTTQVARNELPRLQQNCKDRLAETWTAWDANPDLERTLHITFLWCAKYDPISGQYINAAMLNDANYAANLHPTTATTLQSCPTTKCQIDVFGSPGKVSHLVFDVRVNANVPSLVTAAAEEEMVVLVRELRVFQNTHSTDAKPITVIQYNMSAAVALTDAQVSATLDANVNEPNIYNNDMQFFLKFNSPFHIGPILTKHPFAMAVIGTELQFRACCQAQASPNCDWITTPPGNAVQLLHQFLYPAIGPPPVRYHPHYARLSLSAADRQGHPTHDIAVGTYCAGYLQDAWVNIPGQYQSLWYSEYVGESEDDGDAEDAFYIDDDENSCVVRDKDSNDVGRLINNVAIWNEDLRHHRRAYSLENHDRISERQREYRRAYSLENHDRISERQREYYIANRDCISKRRREYHIANHDRISERKREYRLANHERILEKGREYNLANRDRKSKWHREYQIANHERICERQREHRLANREKTTAKRKRAQEEKRVYLEAERIRLGIFVKW